MKRFSLLKSTAIAATTLLASVSLVACGSDSDGSESGALVVYSNSVSDGRGEWLKEQASDAGFTLEFVDLGGGDIQNRLLAEKANPIADVVFGLNNVFFENLRTAEVLAEYTPAWSEEVDAERGDAKHYWPIVEEPIMLVYNDAAFSTAEAPTDWPDLWKESKFQGRYETPTSLGGATTQMVISGILSRHLDESGDLGVSDEGWKAVEEFFANGSPAVEGSNLYARMANGEVDAGQMWLAGKASREKEYGIDTTAVHPAIGVPMATQQVALIEGSKRPETAKEFIDWFGSAELQAAWSKEFFTAPTNQQALADADQGAVSETASFTPQDIDWTIVAANLPAWIEKIELQYL